MQLSNRQRGLGLWGWIFVLGVIGFTATVAMQLTPIYLAEMAIQRVVKSTANDASNSGQSVAGLRKAMQTRWDVEGITTLDVRDIQLVKHGAGRALHYAYEGRAPLFYNLSIVASFDQTFPMAGGGSVE